MQKYYRMYWCIFVYGRLTYLLKFKTDGIFCNEVITVLYFSVELFCVGAEEFLLSFCPCLEHVSLKQNEYFALKFQVVWMIKLTFKFV